MSDNAEIWICFVLNEKNVISKKSLDIFFNKTSIVVNKYVMLYS